MNIQSIEAARSILALNVTAHGPDEPVRKFVDMSRRIGGNRKASRVFDDFCHLTYCVFAKRTTSDPKIRDDLQRQYDEVAAAYDPADLWAMAGMLGVAREAGGTYGEKHAATSAFSRWPRTADCWTRPREPTLPSRRWAGRIVAL